MRRAAIIRRYSRQPYGRPQRVIDKEIQGAFCFDLILFPEVSSWHSAQSWSMFLRGAAVSRGLTDQAILIKVHIWMILRHARHR